MSADKINPVALEAKSNRLKTFRNWFSSHLVRKNIKSKKTA